MWYKENEEKDVTYLMKELRQIHRDPSKTKCVPWMILLIYSTLTGILMPNVSLNSIGIAI